MDREETAPGGGKRWRIPRISWPITPAIPRISWRIKFRKPRFPRFGWQRPLILVLAIGGVTAVFVGVFGGVGAYRFMENDARFCRTCHTMQTAYTQWNTGEHKDVTCHNCHESDPIASLRQVYEYVTKQPTEVNTKPQIITALCVNCHSGTDGQALAKADIRHSAGGRTNCLLCHGQELHRFQPPAWGPICESCH